MTPFNTILLHHMLITYFVAGKDILSPKLRLQETEPEHPHTNTIRSFYPICSHHAIGYQGVVG